MTTVFHTKNNQIKWKGRTFQQLSYNVKLNDSTFSTQSDLGQIFRARPMKIYRKEIASKDVTCNPRISLKIDDINNPGGTIVTDSSNKGLVNTLDFNYENNTCQHPNPSNTLCNSFLSAEQNARRRVRSSGMTPSKYNINSSKNYFSSTQQYLNNRNISFQNNQYFNIRTGDVTAKPGTKQAENNIYTANSINHCKKYLINEASSFSYFWIDDLSYDVAVPAGEYNIDDLNNLLHSVMSSNLHYFIDLPQKNKVFLLNFVYNINTKKITARFDVANDSIFPSAENLPFSTTGLAWSIDSTTKHVCLDLTNNTVLTQAIGFESKTYPNPQSVTTYTEAHFETGINTSLITDNYIPIVYKPSNSRFAVQGAVSSGDLITRKKYDTITTVGSSFRSVYGEQTANALAYGVSSYGYTLKDKIGYPLKCTPVFKKYTNGMTKCYPRNFTNKI